MLLLQNLCGKRLFIVRVQHRHGFLHDDRTMVEFLIAQDRKKFLKFFDDLKEGMEPEAALSKYFYMGYQQFEDSWRDYAKKL